MNDTCKAASATVALVLEYLMNHAAQKYPVDRFVIIPNHLGYTGVRFPVPAGTVAHRPPPPPENIRPVHWSRLVSEVMEGDLGEFHMTWRWPADDQPPPLDLTDFARERSQRTGERIEIRTW